jgi:hypothetical protein
MAARRLTSLLVALIFVQALLGLSLPDQYRDAAVRCGTQRILPALRCHFCRIHRDVRSGSLEA